MRPTHDLNGFDPVEHRISKTVSVVIVNFNGSKWLRNCLDSLFEDIDISDYEVRVTVVDNDSSDDSLEILESYQDKLTTIALRHNVGFGSGMNRGVSAASSDYFLLLNTDVVVPPGLIHAMVGELTARNLDAIAAREVPYEGGEPTLVRVTIDPLGFPAFLNSKMAMPSFFLPAACVVISREMYGKLGGFDENFFMYVEDVDFFWRARLMGFHFDFAREAVIQHAVHGSSGGVGLSIQRFQWRNVNQPMMLLKNYSWASLVAIIPLYLLFQVLEMVGLLVMRQPRVALTYPRGLVECARRLPDILQERRRIQSARKMTDRDVLRLMYPGLAKLRSLRTYLADR